MIKTWIQTTCLVLGIVMAPFCFAADQGDIYLELKGGSHLEVTTELLSGIQVGYLFSDGIGVGVLAEQIFVTTLQSQGRDGFQVGPEIRWFLEPLEFSGSIGLLSASYAKEVYLMGTGTYLFALTPALAIAADLRVRYTPEIKAQFYFLLGLRTLF